MIKPRVLVAEKDPELAATLTRRLSKAGMEVTVCDDPAAAGVRKEDVDVVVLDISSAGPADSVTRLLPWKGKTPVIFLAANSEAFSLRGLGSWAFAVLAKPFKYSQLLSAIRSAVMAA